MKAVFSILAILAAGGAAFFSFQHSTKFAEQKELRIRTQEENASVSAKADVTEKNLADEQAALEAATTRQTELSQSVATLKTANTALRRELTDLDATLTEQGEEFAQLEQTLKKVTEILAGLGGDVTLDNLPEKIAEIEAEKATREERLADLETLVEGATRRLADLRGESSRLTERKVQRAARLSRNSMEAVVTAVDQDWGFVVIGAGSNSGFSPQTSLLVKRDGQLIGAVQPTSIEPTQTIADISKESIASGVRLQPGDRVILAQPASN